MFACIRENQSRGFQIKDGKPAIVSSNRGGRTVRQIPGADAKSFRAIEHSKDARVIYARDVEHVYMGLTNKAMTIKSADPASFEILCQDGTYAADKKRVFWFGVELTGADPNTFKILEAPYSIDKERAYAGKDPIPVHELEDFEVLEVNGFDAPITNKRNQIIIKGEGAYVSGWSRDGVSYYWGKTELKGANYNALTILNDVHAKDDTTVYFRGKRIRGADSKSFVIIGPGSVRGRDKNGEYKIGKRITNLE